MIAVLSSRAMVRRGGRPRALHAVVVGFWLAASACGPVTYIGEVNRRASDALEAARAAQADKYAPYWWTRAVEYLHKAREVAAHADFQGANRFGKLATEAANQAAADARIAAKDPSKRPLDLPPDVAPAKPGNEPEPPPRPDRATKAARPTRTTPAEPAAAPVAPAKPTEAPIAPARDLPPKPPPRIAPAKEPP